MSDGDFSGLGKMLNDSINAQYAELVAEKDAEIERLKAESANWKELAQERWEIIRKTIRLKNEYYDDIARLQSEVLSKVDDIVRANQEIKSHRKLITELADTLEKYGPTAFFGLVEEAREAGKDE